MRSPANYKGPRKQKTTLFYLIELASGNSLDSIHVVKKKSICKIFYFALHVGSDVIEEIPKTELSYKMCYLPIRIQVV